MMNLLVHGQSMGVIGGRGAGIADNLAVPMVVCRRHGRPWGPRSTENRNIDATAGERWVGRTRAGLFGPLATTGAHRTRRVGRKSYPASRPTGRSGDRALAAQHLGQERERDQRGERGVDEPACGHTRCYGAGAAAVRSVGQEKRRRRRKARCSATLSSARDGREVRAVSAVPERDRAFEGEAGPVVVADRLAKAAGIVGEVRGRLPGEPLSSAAEETAWGSGPRSGRKGRRPR